MAAGESWSRFEVEALVADYLDMLMLELAGQAFVKAEHRRNLMRLLPGRGEGSIEFKYQNVSAVLLDLGLPWMDGYKPARNYQKLLFDVVAASVVGNLALAAAVNSVIERQPEPSLDLATSLQDALVNPPPADTDRGRLRDRAESRPRLGINWLEVEAQRRESGQAGEDWVLRYEDERLRVAGYPELARRIEHVSNTWGDGLGYDIISFETSGRERLIEVKTTAFGIRTPFFVSRNEVFASSNRSEEYHLYRLSSYLTSPRLYTLPGSLQQTCDLEPVNFEARPR